jgi:predicted RNase H-like HicB family nuclease
MNFPIIFEHKEVDGWHVFITDAFPGFYAASKDEEKARNDIIPSLNKLIELDLGINLGITEQQILII